MAKFEQYQIIPKVYEAIQWDGANSTYEALAEKLPARFKVTRLDANAELTTVSAQGKTRPRLVNLGDWIIVDDKNNYQVMDDLKFQDTLEAVTTSPDESLNVDPLGE